MKNNRLLWKKLLISAGIVLAILVLLVVILFGYLTATEYKPKDIEKTNKTGVFNRKMYSGEGLVSQEKSMKSLKLGNEITVLSWNIGYSALGDDADFFMDGGKKVMSSSRERVNENLESIVKNVKSLNPDITMFQEVDVNSHRSYSINESSLISNLMGETEGGYATNYRVKFVPYPVPPIGKVDSGIQLQSKFPMKEVNRIQLPIPFSWPERLGNLKRCLLVSKIPIKDSKRELVVVNLHLEAYDDGTGKEAQTKKLFQVLEPERRKGNYIIAGGDFNQTFSSVDISKYKAQKGMWKPGKLDIEKYKKNWQFAMDNENPSCRSLDKPLENADRKSFQYYIIDGFIVSKNIKVKKYRNVDLKFRNSDHNPVLLNVELEK